MNSFKKDKLKRNLAEQMCDFHRIRFYSLYPSEFHFLLTALTDNTSYAWEKGNVVCDMDYSNEAVDITEDGWDTLQNAGLGRLPTSWPMPNKNAPLFTIPEDAHDDWLDACYSFIYSVNKIKEEAYVQYVTGHHNLQSMGQQYIDSAIERCLSGFRKCKAMIQEMEVEARIARIKRERYEKTLPPKPAEVKVNCLVRNNRFEATATVLNIIKAAAGEYTVELCILDKPIDGKQGWAKHLLQVVENKS